MKCIFFSSEFANGCGEFFEIAITLTNEKTKQKLKETSVRREIKKMSILLKEKTQTKQKSIDKLNQIDISHVDDLGYTKQFDNSLYPQIICKCIIIDMDKFQTFDFFF